MQIFYKVLSIVLGAIFFSMFIFYVMMIVIPFEAAGNLYKNTWDTMRVTYNSNLRSCEWSFGKKSGLSLDLIVNQDKHQTVKVGRPGFTIKNVEIEYLGSQRYTYKPNPAEMAKSPLFEAQFVHMLENDKLLIKATDVKSGAHFDTIVGLKNVATAHAKFKHCVSNYINRE